MNTILTKSLPIEISHNILVFSNHGVIRNGIFHFIQKIPKTDERYKLLDSIMQHWWTLDDLTKEFTLWLPRFPQNKNKFIRLESSNIGGELLIEELLVEDGLAKGKTVEFDIESQTVYTLHTVRYSNSIEIHEYGIGW